MLDGKSAIFGKRHVEDHDNGADDVLELDSQCIPLPSSLSLPAGKSNPLCSKSNFLLSRVNPKPVQIKILQRANENSNWKSKFPDTREDAGH